jgi:hypothetical protein
LSPADAVGAVKAPRVLDPYGELFARLDLPLGDPERLAEIRRKLVWAFAWAVPSPEAIRGIASVGPLIEIGAGTGYWAWLLRQAGADVLAYDRAADAPPRWTEVARGGPEQAASHAGRALVLCWPPMGDPMAADCVERYAGPRVVSIGEAGEGARTGDARFRRLIEERFELEREIEIPRWPGYRDKVMVMKRR